MVNPRLSVSHGIQEGRMPATYDIDQARGLVQTHAWGELTDNDIVEYYRLLRADPAFLPTFNQLCDLRTVTRIATGPATLRDLARSSIFAPTARRAFVTRPEADYGLARMFQAFCEMEGATIGVFLRLEDAETWIAQPAPPPVPG
jgi:hypothetical protein